MERYVGRLLMATAVLHVAVGVVLERGSLRAIARSGVVNAVEPHRDRMAAVWFLLFGAVTWVLGQLADWTQREHGRLPASLGWGLLALDTGGAVLMPVSGFWLVLPQGLLALRASRRGRPA